jgi:hypothetical protein
MLREKVYFALGNNTGAMFLPDGTWYYCCEDGVNNLSTWLWKIDLNTGKLFWGSLENTNIKIWQDWEKNYPCSLKGYDRELREIVLGDIFEEEILS